MEAIDAEYLQISHDQHQQKTLCNNGQRAADLLMMGQCTRQTEHQEHGEVDQCRMGQTRGDKIAHAHKVHHLCRGISKEITEEQQPHEQGRQEIETLIPQHYNLTLFISS